jgi:hypothetical protein
MRTFAAFILLAVAASAVGEPYWVAWEGDSLPEEQGWTRSWGDWSGLYHGVGSVRTVADGVMTMDSLYDFGVFDYVHMERSMDPGPGETFVAEWRVCVDAVVSAGPPHEDPVVTIYSDQHTLLAFGYWPDGVRSLFEPDLFVPLTLGAFNSFRVESTNMQEYTFWVNGLFAFAGNFHGTPGSSEFAWGDSVCGVASLTRWDYLRFGAVIPEPSTAVVLLLGACCAAARLRRARLR